MSHQINNVATPAPRRSVWGARWLAALGIGALGAGLVLAVAAPASAATGASPRAVAPTSTCATTTSTSTSTSQGPVTTTETSTETTTVLSTRTTTVTETETTTAVSTQTTTAVSTVTTTLVAEPKKLAQPREVDASSSGDTSGDPCSDGGTPQTGISARVHWTSGAGGGATVWFTMPESQEQLGATEIAAGDGESFAALVIDGAESGSQFDGIQIHQSLINPGSYQQPSASIDAGDFGPLQLSGPVCSDSECVWTVHYIYEDVEYFRAAGRAILAVGVPPRGPIVTITNAGKPTGTAPATSASVATSTSPATTTTTAGTTTPAATSPEVVVLGESDTEDPTAEPVMTALDAGLASTGAPADRYLVVALLLMLVGVALLVVASGRLHRGERR